MRIRTSHARMRRPQRGRVSRRSTPCADMKVRRTGMCRKYHACVSCAPTFRLDATAASMKSCRPTVSVALMTHVIACRKGPRRTLGMLPQRAMTNARYMTSSAYSGCSSASLGTETSLKPDRCAIAPNNGRMARGRTSPLWGGDTDRLNWRRLSFQPGYGGTSFDEGFHTEIQQRQ